MTSAKHPLKILISRNSSGVVGGAELSALDQAVVLTKLGHSVIFVTGLKKLRAMLPAGIRSSGWLRVEANTGILRQLRMLAITPISLVQAVFFVLLIKPDLINPHSREDQIAFTLTKFIHRRPVVWKDPGDLRFKIVASRSNFLARLNQRLLERSIIKADGVYTLNREDITYLKNHISGLDPQKMEVVPSSILFSRYDKKNAQPKENKFVVGTIIRLHKLKGVQDLINAFLQLSDQKSLELWIIGDGDYRQELERLAGSDKRVRFFGSQSNISPYLAAMDIFVQPAHAEPWGRNIVEAMYFGKPIIGSNVGGIAQQIDDGRTGLLYEKGNVEHLKKELTRLIDDKQLRQKLGANAEAAAEQKGDFETILEKQILPIYKKAISEK